MNELINARKLQGTLPNVVKDALFHDIATLILASQLNGRPVHQNALCKRFGITMSTMQRHIRSPGFIAVYTKLRDEHYGNLGATIVDEKAAPILRENALRTRMLTVVGDTVEELHKRVKSGRAHNALLRTAVEAYATIHDRSPGIRDKKNVQVHVHEFVPSSDQATALRDAEQECGASMADILDVEHEVVDNASTSES